MKNYLKSLSKVIDLMLKLNSFRLIIGERQHSRSPENKFWMGATLGIFNHLIRKRRV
jgi:hypothetical protein